jgi:deoxyhypusine monooxygenase
MLVHATDTSIASLQCKLMDPSTSLPEKYRVMFSLRNVEGELANQALLQGV